MPIRLPACDPCRFSKLACDHAQPVCSRCRDRKVASACTYRSRPFKKRRTEHTRPASAPISVPARPVSQPSANYVNSQQTTPVESPTGVVSTPFASRSRTYPNPGYLGSSSHTTFFDHLSAEVADPMERPGSLVDEEKIALAVNLIEQVHRTCNIISCIKLTEVWRATGVNLALAGLFTDISAQAAQGVFDMYRGNGFDARIVALELVQHSCQPLVTEPTTTIEQYCTQFGPGSARWESLGLFFTAITRATMDVPIFEPLYGSDQERRHLQKHALGFSDRCLDISLSLDCLNDLQLVLQYENWYSHAYINGDQSYLSWRKLGDLSTSLFALGYHQRVEHHVPIPLFLRELRQNAFARAYAADTNVAIFLGRPARIHRKYCRVQFPGDLGSSQQTAFRGLPRQLQWHPDARVSYVADSRWSALCGLFKEEAVDLFEEENYDNRAQKANLIKADVHAQWLALPQQFRLQSALKDFTGRPIERDFILSTHLNYLHVLFLLRLVLQRRILEPDAELIKISANMLSLVTEAVLLKDQLANSGTSILWKVAYYGMAAAGIISLALLNQSLSSVNDDISVAKMIQDLNVLVAVVEAGALVHPKDPNYALLARATQTIKNLLSRLLSNEATNRATTPPANNLPPPAPPAMHDLLWGPWDNNNNLQDFEVDFWLNIAEHPFLTGSEFEVQANPPS